MRFTKATVSTLLAAASLCAVAADARERGFLRLTFRAGVIANIERKIVR